MVEIFSGIDWHGVFTPTMSLLELVARGTIMYFVLFALLRLVLKRQAGAIGTTDVLVIVLLAHISRETLDYHYGKHHQTYVKTLNELIKGGEFSEASLEDIIKRSNGVIFNNAAQVWNHNFYWQCLTPTKTEPMGPLADALKMHFGSIEKFKEEFQKCAIANFGSGWTWLVRKSDGKLAIQNTDDAKDPLITGDAPLLTCDVWEHAYYIDYRNERAKYLSAFWNIVNWDFVASNFQR